MTEETFTREGPSLALQWVTHHQEMGERSNDSVESARRTRIRQLDKTVGDARTLHQVD